MISEPKYQTAGFYFALVIYCVIRFFFIHFIQDFLKKEIYAKDEWSNTEMNVSKHRLHVTRGSQVLKERLHGKAPGYFDGFFSKF